MYRVLWEWMVDWTGSGSCKMASLTLKVSELSAYSVTTLVAPFSSCNHTFIMRVVNITMRQVWTLVHDHGAAACVTAAQQSTVLLTLPSASGCRYATILAASHLRLSHSLPGVACIPQGPGVFYCFTALYQLQRLTPNRCKSGGGCDPFGVIFLNAHRVIGNTSYQLMCERHTFIILVSIVITVNNNSNTLPTPWRRIGVEEV